MEPLCEACQGTGTQPNQGDCSACHGMGITGVVPVEQEEVYFDEKDAVVIF